MNTPTAREHWVLLPGMDATGRLHHAFVEAARPYADVVVVPYPTQEPLDYEGLWPIVQSAVPHGKRFVVIGESFSGPLAVRLAANTPDAIGLVLVASFVCTPWPMLRSLAWLAHAAAIVRLPELAIRYGMVGADAEEALVREVRAAIHSVHPAVIAARIAAMSGMDVRAQLSGYGGPVLVLRATADRLLGATAHAIVAARPDASIARIEAPHLVLQRRPREAVAAILEWRNRSGAGLVAQD